MRRGAVAAIALLLGCSCSSEDPEESPSTAVEETVPSAAVDPDALAGPGTPLLDGFTVAAGSALIGVAVPHSDGTGWTAHLFISGNPVDVVSSYLDQAADHGFEPLQAPNDGDGYEEGPIPAASNRVGRCGLNLSQEPTVEPVFQCAVAASDAANRCFELHVVRGGQLSHGFIRFRAAPAQRSCFPLSVVADLDEPPPAMPTSYPPRPPPGGALPEVPGVPVQTGSHVIGAPGIGDDLTVCGRVNFIGIDEDPDVVLERYVQALRATFPDPALPIYSAGSERDGIAMQQRSVAIPAGGNSYTIQLATRADQSYLYISSCDG
jgi:hypothetical protein